ncbi:hypothetical protein PRUPE_6G018100 [Prunus persica]|uniref:Uncharacterized protein n=2 Tax=Prunus TaxID=3754 RepID=A0AAD4VA02_PRUDU|nr:hypothetical protein L3X38_030271 [Prunus dulcis]ONH99209.1 hypothetical protein PRUPE_6G018100 [Prunus persica]
MGHKKALTGFSTFIIILMVASIPFVQPSRLQVRTFTLTENTNTNTKGLQINQADRFGNGEGAKVFNAVEDSARQVPAGPDPLHHNNNPIGP